MRTTEAITLATAIVGALTGVGGLTLGILSWIREYRRDRVRVVVVPRVAFFLSNGIVLTGHQRTGNIQEQLDLGTPKRIAIQMTNLSAFPVTISDVGFGRKDATRHAIAVPDLTPQHKRWPVRLEPRETCTALAAEGETLPPEIAADPFAYASTACGHTFYGTSEIVSEYVDRQN